MKYKQVLDSMKTVVSEDKLVEALLRRDPGSIEYLYDKYAPALYGVVLRIVKSEMLAEDVMQESFLKVWKRIDAYDPTKGRLFTWLIRIFRNTALDKIRTGFNKRVEQEVSWDTHMDVNQESYMFNIETIGLREMVLNMKPEHRMVIDLMYFEGYTQKEVSEKLSMPLGTVKTHCRVALQNLRKLSTNDRY